MEIWKLTGRHHWWLFSMGYSFKKSVLEMHLGPTESEVWTQLHFGLLKELRNTFFFFTLPPPPHPHTPTHPPSDTHPLGVYFNMEEKERWEGRVSVSSHRCHHCPGVGAVTEKAPCLGAAFPLLRRMLHCSYFLQIKTHFCKWKHRKQGTRQCQGEWQRSSRAHQLAALLYQTLSLCISYLSLWLLHCPLFTGVKERPCHAFLGRHTRAGGEQQKSKGDLCLFLYCVVCVWR